MFELALALSMSVADVGRMSSYELAGWMAYFRARNQVKDVQRGKTPDQLLKQVEMLNRIFGGRDLRGERERTG